MNYPRHYTIDNYLNKVRKHNDPYLETILDKEIIIFPDVMSPKYDRSSQMMIRMMPSQRGKKVLEIGSGTGIISLLCLLQEAVSVVAVDINPYAIENTKENFKKYNYKNYEVLLSDLFEKITDKYDSIIFNAPFHGNKAEDLLELGTSDYNYETLKRFFISAKGFLNPNGEILFGFADTGDNNLLKNTLETKGYKITNFQSCPNGDWTMYLYTIKSL